MSAEVCGFVAQLLHLSVTISVESLFLAHTHTHSHTPICLLVSIQGTLHRLTLISERLILSLTITATCLTLTFTLT